MTLRKQTRKMDFFQSKNNSWRYESKQIQVLKKAEKLQLHIISKKLYTGSGNFREAKYLYYCLICQSVQSLLNAIAEPHVTRSKKVENRERKPPNVYLPVQSQQ